MCIEQKCAVMFYSTEESNGVFQNNSVLSALLDSTVLWRFAKQ